MDIAWIQSIDENVLVNVIALYVIALMASNKAGYVSHGFILFYVACIAIDMFWLLQKGNYENSPIHVRVEFAQTMHILTSVCCAMIMLYFFVAPLVNEDRWKVSFLAAIYAMAFYLVPNLTLANLIETKFVYMSTKWYEYIMSYSIAFDMIIVSVGWIEERKGECGRDIFQ